MEHDYTLPNELQHTSTNPTNPATTQNIAALKAHLTARTLTSTPLNHAPSTGRSRQSYAAVTNSTSSTTQSTQRQEIDLLKANLDKQNQHILLLSTANTPTSHTSPLTHETAYTKLFQEMKQKQQDETTNTKNLIKELQQQQRAETKQMMEEFRMVMMEMMQTIFQQMMSMMASLL